MKNNTLIVLALGQLLPMMLAFSGGPKQLSTASPCAFTINEGQDITICEPGQNINLGVSVDGPYLNASWTPSAGLSNPNSPTTNAIVNQTTTYTLTVSGLGTSNLVYNGDFNLGLTGFTSNYVVGTGGTWGPLSAEGTFTVSTNSSLTHSQFANCTDHTGGGSMLVVNGAGIPNQNVWCQTVAVTPGTAYSFSMWATSVVTAAPAILQISINGSLLGSPFQLPSATCQWNQFFQLWNSGSATSAQICIVNQNTQVGGNDFALDDIVFGPVCQETTEVTITVEEVDASWTPPIDLCPFSPAFSLNALLQPGATPGGTWTINGVPATDFNPALLGPGTFSVSYTVTSLNCTETNTQDIIIQLLPSADFEAPDQLCATEAPYDPNSWLLPTTPNDGQWTVNGSPATQFSPALLGPGIHTITYTVGIPPCINSQSIIIEVVAPPNAGWTAPTALCQNAPAFNLNTLLNPEANTGGQWDIFGTIVTTFNPALLGPGSYAVTYQVGVFPCNASFSTFIVVDSLPVALWNGPDTLCTNASPITLNNWLSTNSTTGGNWTINGQAAQQIIPGNFNQGWQIITYQVGDGACSASHTDSIYIQPVISAPTPTCTQISASTVLITWPGVPGANAYSAQIISGQTPDINNQDTLYFTGLGIGESVRVILLASSPGPCQPVASDTLTCTTPLCGTFPITFTPVDTLCFTPLMDTILLQASVNDPTGLGSGTWSGNGITDSIHGVFNPNLVGVGVHTIYYTYNLNNCLSNDSLRIVIQPRPQASFQLPATACSSDQTTLTFTGTASNQAVFSWFFADANILSGSGQGPYTLSWPGSGQRILSLSIIDGPCSSGLFRDTIYIAPAIDSFVVNCIPGQTQISFTWNRLPDSVQVVALVNLGPTGTFTSDTSYVMAGLTPGQAVSVRFIAMSTGICLNREVVVNCNALSCALVDVQIVPRDTICVPVTSILMQATVTNGSPFGTLTWSGQQINPVTGRWMPSTDWIGLTIPISVTYTEGPCSVSDTILLPIQRKPKPNFTASSPVCQNQPSILQYLGDAMSTATFNWDFSGDPSVTASGPGTFLLTWTEPGVYPLFLIVNENGCDSDPYGVVVRVDQTIDVPQVQCFPTASSIDFVWQRLPPPASFQTTSTSFHTINMLSDTSLRVQNLQPNTSVTIQVVALSNSACPNTQTTITCQTDACPTFNFDINPVAPICWTGSPQQLQLSTTGIPSPAPGQLLWSGPGIINAQTGLWESNPAMAGQTVQVIAAYTTGFCTYRDTLAITVLSPPDAVFNFGTNPVCVGDNATVLYIGSAGNTATFNWNFGAALAIPGNGEGPHVLSFPAAGAYPVTLQVTENGCTSPPYTISLTVSPPTPVPVISCTPSVSGVSFSWNTLSGVSGFTPTLLSPGQNLQVLNDTTVIVSGLMPNESVTLQVLAISNGPCPDAIATLSCASTLCADIPMSIAPVSPICWDGTPTELDLQVTGLPFGAAGQLVWSGSGIVNASTGRWRTDVGMADQDVRIIATYTEGFCVVADTLFIRVNQTPVAAIAISDTLVCANAPLNVSFTGNAPANALYNWNFGSLTGNPGTGAGPHQVSTNVPGTYTISLQVAAQGCLSNTATATLRVEAPLGLPQPDCSPDYTSIVFTWPSLSGASDYLTTLPAGFSGSWLSPTSYQVTGLPPATSVSLSLTAISAGVCPNTTANINCSTLSCPGVTVSLESQPLICAGDSARVTININGPTDTRVSLTLSNGQVLNNLASGTTFAFLPLQTTLLQVLSIANTTLPFCPIAAPPPLSITVEQPPYAGMEGQEFSACAFSDNQVTLFDLLNQAQAGGFWTSQAGFSIPASGSFQSGTGIFNIAQNAPGLYRFVYNLSGTSVCPGDTTAVHVRVLPLPQADAGQDRTIQCNEAAVSIGTAAQTGVQYRWFDQEGNLLSSTDAIIQVGTPGTYRLLVIDELSGCAQDDEVVVIPGTPLPNAVITTNPVSCFGEDDGIIQIGSVSGGLEPISFSFNGGPYTTQTTYAGLVPGVYTISLRDAGGCETLIVTQLQQPVDIQAVIDPVGLEIDPTNLRLGDSLRLVLELNVPVSQLASIQWLPYPCNDCTSLSLLPLQSDAFQVIVTDTNGCVATASLQVLLDRTPAVFIPNAFSPNNDGQNDVLHIFAGKMVSRVNYFAIYDRWGERVFEARDFQANDPALGWDGQHRGVPLQAAVFVYYAEIETIDGALHLFKGDVTLMR